LASLEAPPLGSVMTIACAPNDLFAHSRNAAQPTQQPARMCRSVSQQPPQPLPAPHILVNCSIVAAPWSRTSSTSLSVTPAHSQPPISSLQLSTLMRLSAGRTCPVCQMKKPANAVQRSRALGCWPLASIRRCRDRRFLVNPWFSLHLCCSPPVRHFL